MLLMEAKEKLEKLINFTQTRLEDSADLVEAYQMAVKCIDAQIRLADLLNDFANDLHNDNLYSVGLVYEFLSCIRHDAVFDEDGIFCWRKRRDSMNQISGQMSLFDIAVRTTQQPSEDRLEPKPIADYEWHDIDTPPNDCDYCLFEYTYNKYHANDSIGVCEGWWDADRKSVLWNNMPIDIGKKTVTRYIRIPEWLKYNFTPECEHNSKCLCNRWFGSDEERQSKKDNLPKGYACAGCCWYCSEAPQHGGKCKHECRVFKDVLIKGVFGYEKIQNS